MATSCHNWKPRCKNIAVSKIAKNVFLGFIPIIHEWSEDANNKN